MSRDGTTAEISREDGYWVTFTRARGGDSIEVANYPLYLEDYGGVGFYADSTQVSIFHKPGTDRLVILPGFGSYRRVTDSTNVINNTTENGK